MFLTNEIYSAGLGGFKWRDRILVEGIKENKSLKRKAQLRCFGAYATTLAISLLPFVAYNLIGLGYFMVGVFATCLFLPKCLKKLGIVITPYDSVVLLVAVAYSAYSGSDFLGAFTAIASCVIIASAVNADSRNELILLGGGISSLHPLAIALGVPFSLFVAYRSGKINRNGGWFPKFRKDIEPINLPLGFNKIAKSILKGKSIKGAEARRVQHGSIAERRTAMFLKKLSLPGSYMAHDFPLPGAERANIDHILLTTRGVFVIDTKDYSGLVEEYLGTVFHQNSSGRKESLDGVNRQMQWSLREIRKLLPQEIVKGVILIHTAQVSPKVIGDAKSGIAFVAFDIFEETLQRFPEIYSQEKLDEIAQALKVVAPGLEQSL